MNLEITIFKPQLATNGPHT